MAKGLFVLNEFICLGTTEEELVSYYMEREIPSAACKIQDVSDNFILENVDLDYLDWDEEEISKAIKAMRSGVTEETDLSFIQLLEDLEDNVDSDVYFSFTGEEF